MIVGDNRRVDQAMPFRSYKSSFDPETLQALQDAFNMALAEVLASPEGSVDEQQARDVIAKRIVAAAQESGEHDPERLKAYALVGFNPRQSV
jgi:hypothetical protein